MITFSNRMDLVRKYNEYIKENWLADTPATVIAFLQINHLLKEDEIKIFLHQTNKREKHDRSCERT